MIPATSDSRSITVPASPQALFATLCDVRSLTYWCGPDGFSSTVHEFGLTPGARWLLTLHGPDGASYPNEYRVLEVEQDRLLVLDHPSADHHFVLRIALQPRGDSTEVHLQQSFDNAEHFAPLAAFLANANQQMLVRLAREVQRRAVIAETAAAREPAEVVAQFFAALNRHELEAVHALFDPQILRIEPAGHATAGSWRGADAVLAHLRQGRGSWAEGRCDPERYLEQGDTLVVYLVARVRLHEAVDWSGGRFADGFVVREGRIVHYQTFWHRSEALAWAGIADEDETA